MTTSSTVKGDLGRSAVVPNFPTSSDEVSAQRNGTKATAAVLTGTGWQVVRASPLVRGVIFSRRLGSSPTDVWAWTALPLPKVGGSRTSF